MAFESISALARQAERAGAGPTSSSGRAVYRSQHAEKVRGEVKATKAARATMGPATYKDPAATQKILKKQTGGAGSRIKNAPTRKEPLKLTKPGVPRASERPVMGMKSQRDYLRGNAVQAVTTSPRKVAAARLDGTTGRGGRFTLEESGLVPKYTKKGDFGKVPAYLQTFKQDRARQDQEYREYVREMEKSNAMYEVPAEERAEVLAGLKRNWAQLKKDYQGLSVITDTAAKKTRKTQMEALLAQLESDIEKISQHQTIYVDNR